MVRSSITESVLWRAKSKLISIKLFVFAGSPLASTPLTQPPPERAAREWCSPKDLQYPSFNGGRGIYVHPRASKKGPPFALSFPTVFRAPALGGRSFPCGTQGISARHGCGRSEITDTDRAVGHLQARQPKSREGADKKIVNTSEHVNLFFQRHPAEDGLDPALDVTRRGRGRLHEGLYPDEENNCDRRANLSHGTQRGKPPHRLSVPGHLIISDTILRLVRRESSVSCFTSPQVLVGAGRALSHLLPTGWPTFSSAHEKPAHRPTCLRS